MGALHGSDVALLRHVLKEEEARVARELIDRVKTGLPMGKRRTLRVSSAALGDAFKGLLELLGRPQTAALFVLDGAEHLSTKQIAALRRRTGHPSRDPKLTVGALEDPRPETGRKADGSEFDTPFRRNLRFRISTVARHLTTAGENLLTPLNRPKTDKKPLLATFAIPASEREAATLMGQALLEARFGGVRDEPNGMVPRAILFALLDLVTILARGSKAYVLVLDAEHLDDVADPRALDQHTRPALSLERISARTIYKRRVKAQKVAGVRLLEDPVARQARIKAAHLLGVRGGIKDQ